MPEGNASEVDALIAAINDASLRADSAALVRLMSATSGSAPELWNAKAVGFGRYQYLYSSGRAGEACKIGFSPTKRGLTIYLLSGMVGYQDLLDRLGKHTHGKSCLYIRRLADVEVEVLGQILDRCLRHLDQVVRARGSIPRMDEMPPWDPN